MFLQLWRGNWNIFVHSLYITFLIHEKSLHSKVMHNEQVLQQRFPTWDASTLRGIFVWRRTFIVHLQQINFEI